MKWLDVEKLRAIINNSPGCIKQKMRIISEGRLAFFFNPLAFNWLNLPCCHGEQSLVVFTGLGQRCRVYQRQESGTLLVHWSSANSLRPRPLASQGGQPGTVLLSYLCALSIQEKLLSITVMCIGQLRHGPWKNLLVYMVTFKAL